MQLYFLKITREKDSYKYLPQLKEKYSVEMHWYIMNYVCEKFYLRITSRKLN